MKKQIRIMASVIGLVVSGAVAAAGSTQGKGGQVEFTGAITDVSCNVTSGSTNPQVELGTWAQSYFTGSGVETTKKSFQISVQDCPSSVTQVAVLFDGNKDKTDTTLLAIAPGGATGVGIKLYEANQSKQVTLGKVSDKYPVTAGASGTNTGTADLTFYADYKATGTAVTTGAANGTATFNMIYN